MRLKICRNCKKKFTPDRPMQTTCCFECAIAYANRKQKEKKRKEIHKKKKEFRENDRVWLRKEAQRVVNRYARLRDEAERGHVCCTCGITTGKFDAGHFLPTGSYSAVRYVTKQLHLQCQSCNRFNGGMPKEYRVFMIKKYGLKYVEWLESQNKPRSYSSEYLLRLIKIAKKRVKRYEKLNTT